MCFLMVEGQAIVRSRRCSDVTARILLKSALAQRQRFCIAMMYPGRSVAPGMSFIRHK
jgi:hypothetical protein